MKLRKSHYVNQTPLYEDNFSRLMRLAPGLANDIGADHVRLKHDNGSVLNCNVTERHKFTIVVQLSLDLEGMHNYLANPVLSIRIYFDARVAEVIAYQSHSRFEADYPYPNDNMLQPDEKRQVNQFFGEILNNFLNQTTTFHSLPNNIF